MCQLTIKEKTIFPIYITHKTQPEKRREHVSVNKLGMMPKEQQHNKTNENYKKIWLTSMVAGKDWIKK